MKKLIIGFILLACISCNVDRGYKIIEQDETHMIVKSWVGKDTTIHLERSPETHRCKYIGYRSKAFAQARTYKYIITIYGLNDKDTIIATDSEYYLEDYKSPGEFFPGQVVNRLNLGDSIIITNNYYPAKYSTIKYIFKND